MEYIVHLVLKIHCYSQHYCIYNSFKCCSDSLFSAASCSSLALIADTGQFCCIWSTTSDNSELLSNLTPFPPTWMTFQCHVLVFRPDKSAFLLRSCDVKHNRRVSSPTAKCKMLVKHMLVNTCFCKSTRSEAAYHLSQIHILMMWKKSSGEPSQP